MSHYIPRRIDFRRKIERVDPHTFGFADKYQFCKGCEHKINGVIGISNPDCPALFNPYDDEKCPKNGRFVMLEKSKTIYKNRSDAP